MAADNMDYRRVVAKLKSCRCKGGVHLEECTTEDSKNETKSKCKCKLCSKELKLLNVTMENIPCCEKAYMFIFREEIETHINSETFSINLYDVNECMKEATSYKRVDCIAFIFSKNSKKEHPHIVLIEEKCTASNVSGVIGKKGVSYLSKRIITQEITQNDQNYQDALCKLHNAYKDLNSLAHEKEKLTEEGIDRLVSHLKPLVQFRSTIKWLKELFSKEGMNLEEGKITPLLLIGGNKFYEDNYGKVSSCEILDQYKNVVREYKGHPAKELCKQSGEKVGFEDRGGVWKEVIENRNEGVYSRLIERITEDVVC